MTTTILEAAQDVLGAILADGERFTALNFLKPHHFTEPVHRRIFETATAKIGRGEPVGLGTIRAALMGDAGLAAFDRASGGDYLASLWDSWRTPEYAQEMAVLLAEDWARREAVGLAREAIARAEGDAPGSALEVLSYLRDGVEALSQQAALSDTDARPAPEVVASLIADLAERMTSGRTRGRRCGLRCIDRRMGGLMAGELVVLAGRPSMGKTGLARAIAHGFAVHNPDAQAAFFGLEMGPKEIVYRELSAITRDLGHGVEYRQMIEGPLHPDDMKAVERARASVPDNLVLVDCPNLGLDDVRRRAWALKRKGRLGLIVIDYLQLMRRPDAKGRNEASLIGDITKGLKQLARQMDCTVLLLSQLSRKVEDRDDKRPQLADLRESGHIEQDADFVLFAYREAYYLERQRPAGRCEEHDIRLALIERRMEVITGKARRAPVGSDLQLYHAEYDHVADWHA